MLITVLDSNGTAQTLVTKAQEAAVDHSTTATGQAQVLLAANTGRSGWMMQNRGVNPMYVNDLGGASAGAGSFTVQPGAFFPPPGYPTTTGAISLLGTLNDIVTVREW